MIDTLTTVLWPIALFGTPYLYVRAAMRIAERRGISFTKNRDHAWKVPPGELFLLAGATVGWFAVLSISAVAAYAHPAEEIDAWHQAWLEEVDAAGGLTIELVDEYRDFTDRHQPSATIQRPTSLQTPTPPPPPRTYSAGVEQWRTSIAAYAGWNVDTMLRIMACESGGNPYAVSHTDDHGLLQIHYPIWGPHFGVTRDDLYVPAVNIDLAWRIYNQQGYGAWVCYRR